jgi:hypothetical protein
MTEDTQNLVTVTAKYYELQFKMRVSPMIKTNIPNSIGIVPGSWFAYSGRTMTMASGICCRIRIVRTLTQRIIF